MKFVWPVSEIMRNTMVRMRYTFLLIFNIANVMFVSLLARITVDPSAEDENIEDLMLLLSLLNALISKNYFDIESENEEEQALNETQATEVCVFGIQYVLPLITLDLLKYPTLCGKYYQTITFFIETKSHKVCSLQPELLNSILRSIELGLRSFGLEVQSTCLEFLQILANTVRLDQNPHSFVYGALMPFLRMVLEMIVNQDIGSDNKNVCSSALFALIHCYREQYVTIVQSLLQSLASVEQAERLSKEFIALTNNLDLTGNVNRLVQNQFAERYEKFIANISFMFN